MSKRKQNRRPPGAELPTTPIWSVPVAATDIAEAGKRVDLVADPSIRAALAKAAGLAALPRLEAGFDLTRHGREGVHVTGRVLATVGQNCVVTLEPMESEVDEPIDLLFTPAPSGVVQAGDVAEPYAAGTEEELLRDGVVDLGALAAEFLLLGIDPYPRKPDAAFEAPVDEDPAAHPFAALAALKKNPDEKGG
jgi:uncharacterized metal-binding protein YceD (DUF177 family)